MSGQMRPRFPIPDIPNRPRSNTVIKSNRVAFASHPLSHGYILRGGKKFGHKGEFQFVNSNCLLVGEHTCEVLVLSQKFEFGGAESLRFVAFQGGQFFRPALHGLTTNL